MGKKAIILRGPQHSGKTTAANGLRSHYGETKASLVILDTYWGVGEKRYNGPDRYKDLQDEHDILIIELGCGEPTDWSFKGATRNPQEWISILENAGRDVYFFILEVSKSEAQKRGAAMTWHELYNEGQMCSGVTFSNLIGEKYSENPLNGEKNKEQIVQDIISQIAADELQLS